MRTLFVGGVVGTTFIAPALAAALAPKEIQATFSTRQPFTASTPKSVKYKMVFTADGKITREPDGRAGTKDEGTGKLSRDGFCTAWKGSKANCYTLVTLERAG
jgi:hypothetical protein